MNLQAVREEPSHLNQEEEEEVLIEDEEDFDDNERSPAAFVKVFEVACCQQD